MEKNNILSVLNRSHKDGLMVSVYSNRYQPEMCSVGFIDSLSAGQFIMKHVTPEGIYDGYIIRRIEDVFRVDVNGEYERRLELLYNLQKQKHQDFFKKKANQKPNLFKESLVIAQKKKLIVTICIDETDSQDNIVGFVKDVNPNGITISRISSNGLDDGESTFLIEDVIKINCDSSDERIIKLLYSYRRHDN